MPCVKHPQKNNVEDYAYEPVDAYLYFKAGTWSGLKNIGEHDSMEDPTKSLSEHRI
jgi:hypothetical protein